MTYFIRKRSGALQAFDFKKMQIFLERFGAHLDHINIEKIANSMLAGRDLEIISFTGSCVFSETPKLP